MVTLPIRYPLDKTGTSPNNKIVGEAHTLVNRTVRAVAPSYGPYFSESIIITDVSTGHQLRADQFENTEMDVTPTGMFGKEICSIILIKDQTVSSNIEITYQALGGDYVYSVDAIVSMLNSAEFDNRPVAWPDIIGKPDVFTPASHYHDAGDIYGFEYVVTAIERVRQAILIGDDATHDQILRYIDASVQQVNDRVTIVQNNLNAHVQNMSNPHNTTKVQIGLGNVDNFATAAQVDAENGTSNSLFMTPLRTEQAIAKQALIPLNNHITNTNNPHNTTAAQVGLGNVANYVVASLSDAQTGTRQDAYMTPYLTAQAISAQVGTTLQNHINDTSNPHHTTAAQVGLGNVQNFSIATTPDAQAGTRNDLYMTPARTTDAISYQVGNAFTAHVNNFSNPHNTTKAQVGLGNVDNFPTATQQQAQAGTDNASFMTPLRTAQAISVIGGALVNAHASRTDNPHSTTKAQVGLGNVDNFATATTADAQAGTSTTLFMTPADTKAAIQTFAAPAWYQGWVAAPGWDANALPGSRSGFTYAYNAPYTGPLVRFDSGGYDLELNSAYNGQGLAYRTHNSDANAWNGWQILAHSDGSNASGTWAISITGNAANATHSVSSDNSTYSGILSFQGNQTAPTGSVTVGGTFQGVYNNGYPITYGNVLSLQGNGAGQLLLGWSGTTGGIADNYIRSMRDTGNTWSPWSKILTDANYAGYALSLSQGGTVQAATTFNAIVNTADLTVNGNARTGNWWRSTGNTGWYNETYAVGWYATQAGYIDGYNGAQIRATEFWSTSDERIKTDIVRIKNARERLFSTVEGFTFLKNGIPSMGLLAQQVEKNFGVAVTETNEELPDGSKIKTVNYGIMIAPVIEAAREIDEDLTQLRDEHENLKKDHAELKADFEQLKRQVQALLNK